MGNFIFLLFLLIGLLWACSPQQKLQRLLGKHPELVKTDTVKQTVELRVKDTVYIAAHSVDTVLPPLVAGVPLEYEDGRLKLSFIIDSLTRRLHLKGGCKGDTIIKEIPVRVEVPVAVSKVVAEKEKDNGWSWLVVAVFLVGAFLLGVIWVVVAIYKMVKP